VPYRVTSREFEVRPWSGITAGDLQREPDGRVSLKVGPRNSYEVKDGGGPDLSAEIGPIDYPDSYDSPAAFIDDAREFKRDPAAPGDASKVQWYCLACSWRPWADSGDAERVELTFTGLGGSRQVPARRQGDRWVSEQPLPAGWSAYAGRGCVADRHGDFNGSPSAVLGRAAADVTCPVRDVPEPAGGSGGGAGAGPGFGVAGAPGSSRPVARRCRVARGRVAGKAVGAAALGRTRGANRRAIGPHTRPRRSVDRFCHGDGRHTRIGYRRGRAVFIGTTSTRFVVGARRPGGSARGLRGMRVRVGVNVWVVRRGRGATRLFKVRGGRVRELGLADRRLTRSRRSAKALLRSFR
jgi:hypothetical protein